MYCMHCGKEIPDNSRFCSYCGQEVTVSTQPNKAAAQNKTSQTDWAGLVSAFTSGCAQQRNDAFTALYNGSYQKVYAHVLRYAGNQHAAEDAVQNAYIRCWERMDQLDNAGNFLPWIKQIAYNEFLQAVRKDAKLTEFANVSDDEGNETFAEETLADDTMAMPEDAYANEELHRLLLAAMDELSDAQRVTMKGFYFDSKPMQTLAEELGVPVNTIKTYLLRGRRRMESKVSVYANAYGLKLAPIAILPFMAALAKEDVQACEIAAGSAVASGASVLAAVQTAVGASSGAAAGTTAAAGSTAAATGATSATASAGTATGAASAGAASTASAGSAAATGAAGTAVHVAGSGFAVKAVAGIAAVAVAAGGVGAYRYVSTQHAQTVVDEDVAAEETDTATTEMVATTETVVATEEETEDTLSAVDQAAAQEILKEYLTQDRMWEGPGMGYVVGDPGNEYIAAEDPVYAIADLDGDGVNELWVGARPDGMWSMHLLPADDNGVGSVYSYNAETDTYLGLDLNDYGIVSMDKGEVGHVGPGYDADYEWHEEPILVYYGDDMEVVSEESMTEEEYDAFIADYIPIGDLVNYIPLTQENVDALAGGTTADHAVDGAATDAATEEIGWYIDEHGLKNDALGIGLPNFALDCYAGNNVEYHVGHIDVDATDDLEDYDVGEWNKWNDLRYETGYSDIVLSNDNAELFVEIELGAQEMPDVSNGLDDLFDMANVEVWDEFSRDYYAYEEGGYIYCPSLGIRIVSEPTEAVRDGGYYSMPHVCNSIVRVFGLEGVYNSLSVENAQQAVEKNKELVLEKARQSTAESNASEQEIDVIDVSGVTIGHYTYIGFGYHHSGEEYVWWLVSDDSGYLISGDTDSDSPDELVDMFRPLE